MQMFHEHIWTITVIGLMLLSVSLSQAQNSTSNLSELTVRIVPDSNCGGIDIKSPLLPDDVFDDVFNFRTCEGILDGNRDFGLFRINLADDASTGTKAWKRKGKHLWYEWSYPQGILLRFSARIDKDSLLLSYTIKNNSTKLLKRVLLHPCLPTTRAKSFFPQKKKSEPYYTDLYRRVFLWSNGRPFPMSENEYGDREAHLAFMKKGETPVQWAWWKNSKKTFDIPLIAVTSKDGQYVIAYCFEKALWASCNTGDERACVHLFPYFGQLRPGESSTVKGRLYILRGSLESVFKRYMRDFGKKGVRLKRNLK